jgi:hypothetical protein
MSVDEARRTLQSDNVAQQLLSSPLMARLAYTWHDGTPRVIPMWFAWTGEDILMGAPPNSPKMKALAARPEVAIAIDGIDWPYQWLNIRGNVSIEIFPDAFDEYKDMARRYLGDAGGEQFLAARDQTFDSWARLTIQPEEVRILDFQGRFPGAWMPK